MKMVTSLSIAHISLTFLWILLGFKKQSWLLRLYIYTLQEGLLCSLTSLQTMCLSRNSFTSYPVGGPQQFATVYVSITVPVMFRSIHTTPQLCWYQYIDYLLPQVTAVSPHFKSKVNLTFMQYGNALISQFLCNWVQGGNSKQLQRSMNRPVGGWS